MTATSPPAFGKRKAPRRGTPSSRPRPLAPLTLSPEQVAVLAAAHEDIATEHRHGARTVPRSTRAAFLSGLVIGCALAGFDATGGDGAARVTELAKAAGITLDPSNLLPGLILLGLLGGARASALTVIAVHRLLNLSGETRHAGYAAGGAVASLALVGAVCTVGHPPAHGWVIEALSGAGAGFFYRVFAGSRAA